jgi:urate oxidase
MARLAENHYGKSRVRLLKVIKNGSLHEVREWNVGVYLQGDFERHFREGDNAGMMATDTMKNTVYSVAKESSALTIEDYAQDLARLLSDRNPQAGHVRVTVEEKMWIRIKAHGERNDSAFMQRGPDVATTELSYTPAKAGSDAVAVVTSGVKGLVILKTSKSGFVGFKRDRWTTLPEVTDRLFGTEATIAWVYSESKEDYAAARTRLMDTLLTTFADHDSLSVQQTLFQMAEDALAVEPGISEITLTMPNRHNNLVDLSRFGQENANEIFIPTDEPHGQIQARVVR